MHTNRMHTARTHGTPTHATPLKPATSTHPTRRLAASAAMTAMTAMTALALLAGCSPSTDQAPHTAAPAIAPTPASRMPTQAQVDAFLAEGQEPTLQKLRPLDYWLHYKLMQSTGIEQALGGEAQSVAALKALGDAYERKLRGTEADLPKMIPAAFTGEGMGTGLIGMDMGGFAGMLTGGMMRNGVSGLSDERLAELISQGPVRFDGNGGSAEFTFDEHGGMDQTLEYQVNESGLTGKVKVKIHMDACPDASGKLTVKMEVDSQISVTGKPGTGGSVHSEFTYERYLDDDAHLVNTADGGASELHIRMSGKEGGATQAMDMTVGYERGGKPIFQNHGESGFSIFRMDEVDRAAAMLESAQLLHTLIAEAMLRGLGAKEAPWEGGRCVKLDVTSNPAKRTGIKPNTAFDLEAKPRAKSDGAPTRGSVTATLNGSASLLPAGGKVPADAKYSYAGPEKKDQVASIDFEARSKRGVARATLSFDTKSHRSYQAEGGLQAFHGTGTICDLAKPFTISGGGNTVSFSPASEAGGKYSYKGNMSGIGVYGNGTYTATADDSGGSITGSGNGCVKTPMGIRCAGGIERYKLTPIETCE